MAPMGVEGSEKFSSAVEVATPGCPGIQGQ